MTHLSLSLSWPPSSLSPNKRLHWAEKARVTKSCKRTWEIETRGILGRAAVPKGARKFRMQFQPPDRRPRDVDNIIASCKALIDALSAATGVDDSRFEIAWPRKLSEPTAGGAIVVEVLG